MSKSITSDEYDFIAHHETELTPETVAKIRTWLQPTDYLAESGEFRKHLLSQAPGTGLWICQTEEYHKWHDSPDHGSLWIKGAPGTGKSVAAASIVQHLRATENHPVLFFFFRNIIAANFSPRALIQDWLAQLLPHSPKLQNTLEPLLKTSLEEISDSELFQLLFDGMSNLSRVYCIGDALDEMTTDNKLFLDKLNSLATFRPNSLKLLITSRPKQYLQSALRDSLTIHIDSYQRLVDTDIKSYLSHRFDNAPKADIQNQAKKETIEMVAKRSEGLFLYGKLAMDQISAAFQSNTLIDLQILEDSLPTGLEETYNRMLAKQREEHGIDIAIQLHVLQAVTHASRPLRLNELAALTRVMYPNLPAPAGFKSLVATSCGPLVEILEDETLQVIHHSFTEFLRGDTRIPPSEQAPIGFPIIGSKDAHKWMALSCLEYLQSGSLLLENERSDDKANEVSVVFQKPRYAVDLDEEHYQHSHLGLKRQRDSFDYREARLLHPFLAYAVENWSYHCNLYDSEDEELFSAIKNFLNPNSLSFHRWLVLQWGSTSRSRDSTEGVPQALHIAAYSGLSKLVAQLIEQGSSVSIRDAQERTPLHWAAAQGHSKVISLLIQCGSDPNAEDGRGLKPIHLAARKNRASAVTTLLEAGVEPNTIKTKENHAGRLLGGEKVTKGECAILYAAQAGHLETIIAMIPFCKGKVLEQLLCLCCRYSRTDAVMAILEQSDVSADATFEEATALYFACTSANPQCVEALIKRGANVGKTSSWLTRRFMNGPPIRQQAAKAPLHQLVQVWYDENHAACREIFRMLVKANADIEQLDGDGNSPLVLATGDPHKHYITARVQAMRSLLEAGANARVTLPDGDGLLHVVLRKERNYEAVRLLIEHGCNPNQKAKSGETPLHLSVHSYVSSGVENTEAIVRYLVDHGAKTTSAIVEKSMSVGFEVFRHLLSKCVDKAVKCRCWFKMSSISPTEKFVKFLEVFLAEGMDIETRAANGRSLYLFCLNDQAKLDILRSHGARKDAVDDFGNNALHILASTGHRTRDRMERLIADGVNPAAVNNDGDTLLHKIAHYYNYEEESAEFVRWLVGLGIPVNAVNKNGLTAMHVALRAQPIRNDSGNIHFVEAINCNNDVDLEFRDNDGLTVLHIAAMQDDERVKVLLSAGANINTLTTDSQNVLHLACRAAKPNLVGQLLDLVEAMDSLYQKDKYGRTPLHLACSSGQPETVKLLLEAGVDVDAVDKLGRTALHACAEYRLEQNIWETRNQRDTWLRGPPKDPLRPGCATSRTKRTPWYAASYMTSPRPKMHNVYCNSVGVIAKLLLGAGCNPGVVDSLSQTALDLALDTGCIEFSDVFLEEEDMFFQATLSLEKTEETKDQAEELRHLLKAQMLLVKPKSSLDILRNNAPVFEAVKKSPDRLLELFTAEDAAHIINEGFKTDPLNPINYATLQELMKPQYVSVIERVPDLIKYYSSESSLAHLIERERQSGQTYYLSSARTALQLACQQQEPNMLVVQLLVEKLNIDINEHSSLLSGERYSKERERTVGGAALHVLADASQWWHPMAIEYLIEHGADVNAVDENGQSPLHVAAQGAIHKAHANRSGFWRFEAVSRLLSKGANPNIMDKSGCTPLHIASSAPDIMRLLLKKKADSSIGRNPLFMAIYDQSLGALEALLDHGLSVDSVNEKEHSRNVHYSLTESRKVYALLCTAFAAKINTHIPQSVPLLRALVERGADLYPPLNDKETLIHFLFEYPAYEVLDTLLNEPCASRIDFNRRDQRGRTVLIAACDWREVLPGHSHKHWEPPVIAPPMRMLGLGADAMAVDNDGRSALHHILVNRGLPDKALIDFINREEVAPTLLRKDNKGFTPFHSALGSLRPKVCELMLEKGANLQEPCPDGRTALHYIAEQCMRTKRDPMTSGQLGIDLPEDYLEQCTALWNRFISEGGSINARDNHGNTPLHTFLLSPVTEPRRRQAQSNDVVIGHLEVFSELFPSDSRVDIFATNNAGDTGLHMIARREKTYYTPEGYDKRLFETMMAKGLDVLKEDIQGRSALDVADACGKDDIVGLVRRK